MTSWFDFAMAAADRGLVALTYNNRGYGASDGDREDYDVGIDALAAIRFAREGGAEKIFYVGASMNGTAALYVGAREDLAGIASLSGVPEFAGTDGMGSTAGVGAPKLFVAAGNSPRPSTGPRRSRERFSSSMRGATAPPCSKRTKPSSPELSSTS
jgi:pimeloyl-ACP methyl ester carboxylesterase